jgi:glycosyltransferase involved in cell wall biosynthesis
MFIKILQIFFKKNPSAIVPKGYNLSKRPKVAILVESTIPPVSRANLRMYWLAQSLIKEKKIMVNIISPSTNFKTRHSYFVGWIWMNQYPGFSSLLYSNLRLPIRIWHFMASILSIIVLEYWYRKMNDFGFSVIHAWNPLAGLAAVIAGKIIRRPVFVDFTDFYSDIARTDMPLFRKPLIWLENYVLKNSAKIFVVSEEMRLHLVSMKAILGEKIYIVPDGTDSAAFKPNLKTEGIREKLGIDKNAPLLVFHGDIKNDDGVDILCMAFSKVLQKRPDARLLILGGGQYFEMKIRPLINELGIEGNVITPGWVPHKEVPYYLNACDIGAMTMRATLNHDNYLSFKLFEYWGCGKPVVVTKLKAIGRIVRHGVNGLIVDSEDVEGFANAFLELIENPQLAQRLGAEGRRLVESEYDWLQIMKKECKEYDESLLIGRGSI